MKTIAALNSRFAKLTEAEKSFFPADIRAA